MSKLVFSIKEFCADSGISTGMFYKILKQGLGPRTMKVGRRTLISSEAANDWRKAMESKK